MRFPIAIEPGDEEHAFGVVVPDLPGCFSAGDTLDEALANAEEAISLWIEERIEADESIPEMRPLEEHRRNPTYEDWMWAVVNVDFARLSDRSVRVNITLPERLLGAIDLYAKRHGESRSGFLARAATQALRS